MRATSLPVLNATTARLVDAVQANCDVADATHARERSLCTYLLAMREYFRWATDLPLGTAPDTASLGRWIAQHEERWEDLRANDAAIFQSLPLSEDIEAFAEDRVNDQLVSSSLVYGAGIGLFGAPLFFLADKESEVIRDGVRVIVTGRELARGVSAPPAMSRGDTVTVRRDALRRWLWTRLEGWQRRRRDDAFAAALHAHEGTDGLDSMLDRMADGEVESLVLHELGELQATRLLGPVWEDMLANVGDRKAELALRAVRDLLADCLVTLPALMEKSATASLLFWFANLDGHRRALAPELAAAYSSANARIDLPALEAAVHSGRERWRSEALELTAHWRAGGAAAVAPAALRLCNLP